MFINHSSREVTAKIVYYGPGLSGKTTNLQYIFSVTNPLSRGELVSIETKVERTLFFDLLPINVGPIEGYQTKFQLYTVPGQVFYDATRKLVLKGADGIVFVADSQELMGKANLDSLENLITNLAVNQLSLTEIPIVFQYNKQDLSNSLPVEQLDQSLNHRSDPWFAAAASNGEGVLETLRGISSLILKKIKALLAQREDDSEEPPVLSVEFDTNKAQKIIEKENLPLKKIHPVNLNPGTGGKNAEKIDETEPFGDLGDLPLVEGTENFDALAGPGGFRTGDETIELRPGKNKGFPGQPKFDSMPEEMPEMDEFEADETEEIEIRFEDAPPLELEQFQEIADENRQQTETEPKPGQEKTTRKEKSPPGEIKGFELFRRLQDSSRVTVIEEIRFKGPALRIEIKDRGARVLKSINVAIKPETRKVNLILDIKK